MILSRWRADTGGYDYFADARQHPLGNDLPVPSLRELGGIGAPSTDIGRTGTSTGYLGSGPFPKGVILPTRTSGASLAGYGEPSTTRGLILLGLLAGAWGVYKYTQYRDRMARYAELDRLIREHNEQQAQERRA